MNVRNKLKSMIPSKCSTQIKKIQMLKERKNIDIIEPCKLYNSDGELIHNYYLCDGAFQLDYSATKGRVPKYIFWDKEKYNLKYHFYTDDMIFTQKGKPDKKYALLIEPETLQPKKYKTILKDPSRFLEYDVIFTHSERVLNALPNAKPIIIGGVYVGTSYGGGTIDSELYKNKSKNISIVSSNKHMCELHEFRYLLAKKYEKTGVVDCYGTFNGGKQIKIWESLRDYRYSFAIENNIEPYWITERICNCFATMTVPIYLGSPKIGDYFNMDGIICINKNDFNNMDKIISQCNEVDYNRRIDAIRDNFERVQKFYCLEDWLYNNYKNILP